MTGRPEAMANKTAAVDVTIVMTRILYLNEGSDEVSKMSELWLRIEDEGNGYRHGGSPS